MKPVVLREGGRHAWRVLLLTGCLILGVLGLGAVEAHAATPSSLAGETFTSNEVKGSTLTGTCPEDLNGTNGSFNFSVSGTAAGPFPGTFTESGSFSTSPTGHFNDFSSTFTITSTAAGTVTGTKSLLPEGHSLVTCSPGPGGTQIDVSVVTSYRATIPGVGQDTGTATVSMRDNVLNGSSVQLLSFSENFGSTGALQKQCKHGGWESFGTRFKNQGDCVSFFATRGKNPPSGS